MGACWMELVHRCMQLFKSSNGTVETATLAAIGFRRCIQKILLISESSSLLIGWNLPWGGWVGGWGGGVGAIHVSLVENID